MRSDAAAVETSAKIAMRVLAARRMASRIFQLEPPPRCICFAAPTRSADHRHIDLPVDRVRKSARHAGRAGPLNDATTSSGPIPAAPDQGRSTILILLRRIENKATLVT
ncbi:hypothetical protein [Bradyrhizobium sp. USDA 4451]